MNHTRYRRQVLSLGGPPRSALGGQRRYFDRVAGVTMVRVFQGDYYATSNPNEALTTTLGSCIAVCMRDPIIRFGGMNHFVLPAPSMDREDAASLAMRYGSFAIEQLINVILGEGGQRERLEVKVFGGANIIKGMGTVGFHNADFVEEYMHRERMKVVAAHLRGAVPRKIRYWPATGLVQMRELQSKTDAEIFDQEARLQADGIETGKVELFR